LQRRIDQALINKQRETALKRSKPSSSAGTDKMTELSSVQVSYLAQKSALEAHAGSKGKESGKWLVR
jgi:hypothetical protein